MSKELPARVASALRIAEIDPSRRGSARRERVRGADRELYLWILRHFATNGRPRDSAIRGEVARIGLDYDTAKATLAREDLVHFDREGEVTVAYPFSGRPTAHRVRFSTGTEAYAMCALDALGIAPMFEQEIEIASRDPCTGEEIRARVLPSGEAEWQPESAVVVAGIAASDGDSCACCCPVLNFFASAENAERWLVEHPSVRGEVVSMPEAAEAGGAVFGDVLGPS